MAVAVAVAVTVAVTVAVAVAVVVAVVVAVFGGNRFYPSLSLSLWALWALTFGVLPWPSALFPPDVHGAVCYLVDFQ